MPQTTRGGLPAVALLILGVGASGLAAIDPARSAALVLGVAAAALGLALERRAGLRSALAPFCCLLVGLFVVATQVRPAFRADSASYYVYLRSFTFDRDLDFSNEWEEWGYAPGPKTATGLYGNTQSVGPALVWSPFFALSHAYVVADAALLGGQHAADGYATPYVRSTLVGTLSGIAVGAWLLGQLLRRTSSGVIAVASIVGGVAASPILYYAFVLPTMAHGLAFGAAAAFLWAWDRVRRGPSLESWLALGALLGLVTLLRWQAIVFATMVAPLAVVSVATRRSRPQWVLAGALASLLVFSPQLVAWKTLYGSFVTIPQGGGFMDWSSPRWLATLTSANHGLFTWSPLLLLGLLGLIARLRRDPLLHGSGLLTFCALVWVNGGVADWAGSDAFGARRFDVAIPLLILGIAASLGWLAAAVSRRPMLVPGALVATAVLWNVGFAILSRAGRYSDTVPLERLAHDQLQSFRLAAQRVLGRLVGPRGAAFAYDVLAAEYLYEGRFNPSGTINLVRAREQDLAGGWSPARRPRDGPGFRWAYHPEACVRVPLREPFDIDVVVTARAPRNVLPQLATLVINGQSVGSAPLDSAWRELPFRVPERYLVPGENALCLRFAGKYPSEPGRHIVAAVAVIQLP